MQPPAPQVFDVITVLMNLPFVVIWTLLALERVSTLQPLSSFIQGRNVPRWMSRVYSNWEAQFAAQNLRKIEEKKERLLRLSLASPRRDSTATSARRDSTASGDVTPRSTCSSPGPGAQPPSSSDGAASAPPSRRHSWAQPPPVTLAPAPPQSRSAERTDRSAMRVTM